MRCGPASDSWRVDVEVVGVSSHLGVHWFLHFVTMIKRKWDVRVRTWLVWL